jgi:hypothetical protein
MIQTKFKSFDAQKNKVFRVEQKTSGEIFEDVFMEDTLDNKNKLWISKDSLIERLNIILYKDKDWDLYINSFIKELENKK